MNEAAPAPRRFVALAEDDGSRLDHFLAARAGTSHAAARRAVESGGARINGRRARKGERVRRGDEVRLDGPIADEASLRPRPEPEAPLDVLLLDEDVVAVNKPAGMAGHPLAPGETGTLAGALVARFPECARAGADPREAGFAHRLDVDTSGVLLAARHAEAWAALRRVFHEGRADKEYLALVMGKVERGFEVALSITHAPGDARRVLCVPEGSPHAQPARTRFEPLGAAAGLTLVRAHSSTGRMHQVRAHLASAGHPIVGDVLYGGPPAEARAPGHFLHAARLRLPHPRGGLLDVTAPLPEVRAALLARLGLSAT